MSIHDETWNKCEFCNQTIKDWDGDKHTNGKCTAKNSPGKDLLNMTLTPEEIELVMKMRAKESELSASKNDILKICRDINKNL